MKPAINRWLPLYLGLFVFGWAVLAFHFRVIAGEERERLILSFVLIGIGIGAIFAGLAGLLVLSIKHLLSLGAKKDPVQPPRPSRGNRT